MLRRAGVSQETSTAVLEVNQQARLVGLRAALVVFAGVALLALFAARRIPTEQPGSDSGLALGLGKGVPFRQTREGPETVGGLVTTRPSRPGSIASLRSTVRPPAEGQ